ncbi:MAG TPA: hypothetical protein VHB46_17265 [Burkholderiales bacterium]|nr:hypothetical protein [Burkholderiales bacterium]
MDSFSLSALAFELLASVHSLTGYAVPGTLPEIHQAPLAEVRERFCHGSCAAEAFYNAEDGIYIDEALDLEKDEFARSILLHELVHYAQRVSGTFEKIPSPCVRWFAAERQAYQIQNLYLEAVHDAHRVNVNAWRTRCDY